MRLILMVAERKSKLGLDFTAILAVGGELRKQGDHTHSAALQFWRLES